MPFVCMMLRTGIVVDWNAENTNFVEIVRLNADKETIVMNLSYLASIR